MHILKLSLHPTLMQKAEHGALRSMLPRRVDLGSHLCELVMAVCSHGEYSEKCPCKMHTCSFHAFAGGFATLAALHLPCCGYDFVGRCFGSLDYICSFAN